MNDKNIKSESYLENECKMQEQYFDKGLKYLCFSRCK